MIGIKTVSVVVNTKKDIDLSVTKKVVSYLSEFAECVLISDEISFEAPSIVKFVSRDCLFTDTQNFNLSDEKNFYPMCFML